MTTETRADKRILKIWDADYPWDVRVEKIATGLAREGFEVHLVARNRARRAPDETIQGIRVHRLPLLPFGNGPLSFPAFANPLWVKRILSVGRSVTPDLVIVRDLPLAPAAVWVARRLGVPVILDNAENYPAMLRDIQATSGRKPWDLVLRNPRLAARVEKWTLPRVNHVWVVVEEARERMISLGVSPDRVTIVGNTPLVDGSLRDSSPRDTRGPELTAAYLGLLEWPRGLATAIRALALARERGLRWRLEIIGQGRDSNRFEDLAKHLGVEAHVRFQGWMENRSALRRVAQADVGLIPHHAIETWNATVPNKLFDYMRLGLPVLASSVPPVERILRETRAGLVFRDRDAADMADCLAKLGDPDLRRALGENGRLAVAERYNWLVDQERAVASLRRLLAEKGGTGLAGAD